MAGIATGLGDLGGSPDTGGLGDLGAALGEAYDAASGAESPGGEAGEGTGESGLPSEGGLESPGGEAPSPLDAQPAQSEPAQSEGAQPGDSETGWKMSPDGSSYLVPKTEFPRVQNALKFADSVGQIFTSPAEAQSAAQQAFDLRSMTNDWQYGADNTIQSVLQYWAGAAQTDPGTRAMFQRSFAKMAGMVPGMLKQIDPGGYQNLLQSTVQAKVESLYEKAAQSGNPQDFQDAQSVEWGLTGRYRTELPRVDPNAVQLSTLQQQQQQFEQRQNAALQRDVANFNTTAVEGAKGAQLGTQIDKLLEKIKPRFSEVAYTDLKAGIYREAIDTLRAQEWWGEHRQNFDQLIQDFERTWRQGTPGANLQPRVQSYIQDFMGRAGRILPSIAQKRINATTASRVGTNGKPSTGTRPPAQNGQSAGSPSPASQRPNGSPEPSRTEKWDREWASMFK